MLKKRFDFLVATVFLGLLPIDAHAYLDPGTGSMLLSVVMGLVSTGYFVIRRLPSMMRALFFRMTGKRDDLKTIPLFFILRADPTGSLLSLCWKRCISAV